MAEEWILDLKKELQLPYTPLEKKLYPESIYRVPKNFTDVNDQAYEPKRASFGPYHHNCLHLRPMQHHKYLALFQFLRRIANASKTPDDVLIAMRKVELCLRDSYDNLHINEDNEDFFKKGHFHHYDWLKKKDEFLKLMIVDSCFALEVMLADKRCTTKEQSEYDSHDPVLGTERVKYIIFDLKRDMLLCENQIPLLALTTLASIEGSGIEDVSALIKAFYNLPFASLDDQLTDKSLKVSIEQSFHILDMYRKILTADGEYLPNYEQNMKSATELKNAGVSFCKSKSRSFNDISFNGGVLSLPLLEIDTTTESLLLNLIAFERLHATTGNEVIAYAFFMNCLINTANDVALLRNKKIITGLVGSDENIVRMFNRITNEVTLVGLKNYNQDNVKNKLNIYCKKRMHRWIPSLCSCLY